jgi:amidase
MEVSEYSRHDATGLRELIDRREVAREEVLDAALRAIDEVEPRINALSSGPFAEPIAGADDGSFAGVPFVLKDLGASAAGYPLESGSRMFAGFVPEADTELMTRFRRAGLVTLARAASPEFGFNANTAPVDHGPVRNPWDTDRIPGGSSGGSAAVVAARAVPMAHASDGGGSIRIPASCCGLVGLKPTRGRVPVGPEVGEALSGLAIEFALTRTVRDCAVLLDAVCGPGPGEKYYVARPARPYARELNADPGRLRVAVRTETFGGVATSPEVASAVEAVGRTLEDLGHVVEPASPELDFAAFQASNVAIWTASLAFLADAFGALVGRRASPDNVEAATWAAIQHGRGVSGFELAQAAQVQNVVTRAFGRFLDEYDLLLTPTLPVPPLPVGSFDQNDPRHTTPHSWFDEVTPFLPFTPIFNTTGQPSLSLPLGMSSDGLPIGVMLNAQSLREDLLLRVASRLEEAMPWAERVPAVCAGAAPVA